ncbi:glycosyltransferase family 29 protein [Paracoccus liaowanqingii]|nr:glycosyltransferase family 29 protein [Paracoccus liaowanqingii]
MLKFLTLSRQAEPVQSSENESKNQTLGISPLDVASVDALSELQNAKYKDISKLTFSGIARLLERAEAKIVNLSVENGTVLARLECAGSIVNVTFSEHIAHEVARSVVSGPTQDLFETVRDDLWQIRTQNGRWPFVLIPLNAALWKIAGLGEEVVFDVRERDFHFGEKEDRFSYERGQLGRLFGVLDEVTRADYAQAVALQIEPSQGAVMGWIRNEWKSFGTTLQVRDEIKRLISKKMPFRPNQLLIMAAFFCDAGEYGYALTLLKMANSASTGIWGRLRIPALTRLLVREGHIKWKWAEAEAELVDFITGQEGHFSRHLRENRDSFAIVGNGPRQVGLGTGSVIDKAKIVIRLNTGRPNANFAGDYGWKQNVWVKNQQNYDVKRTDKTPGLEHVIISGSNALYRTPNSGFYLRDLVEAHGSITLLPEEFLRQTIARTKRNPSSGIVMLTWLDFLAGGLQDQKNVFGFSLNDQKVRQTTHYFRDQPIASHHTHNWDIEREYFDEIVSPARDR